MFRCNDDVLIYRTCIPCTLYTGNFPIFQKAGAPHRVHTNFMNEILGHFQDIFKDDFWFYNYVVARGMRARHAHDNCYNYYYIDHNHTDTIQNMEIICLLCAMSFMLSSKNNKISVTP